MSKGAEEWIMLLEISIFFVLPKWKESPSTSLFLQWMKGNNLEIICKPILEMWPSLKCQILQELLTGEL